MTGVFTLAGSYDNNGTYTASGGTLTFDGSGVHTIAAGNGSFNTLVAAVKAADLPAVQEILRRARAKGSARPNRATARRSN